MVARIVFGLLPPKALDSRIEWHRRGRNVWGEMANSIPVFSHYVR